MVEIKGFLETGGLQTGKGFLQSGKGVFTLCKIRGRRICGAGS
jgi:hypothetical protein